MTLIQKLPVPVIAKVNGLATAAGCQLVASCDIAVASEKSQFATPGVNIGLFCSTPAVALGRSLPRKVGFLPRDSSEFCKKQVPVLGVLVQLPKLYFPAVHHSKCFTAKDTLIILWTGNNNKGMMNSLGKAASC